LKAKKMQLLFCLSLLFGGASSATPAATSKNITISNVSPRLDVHGNIVNAHDGTIRFAEGAWWLHAASYGAGDCDDPPHEGCEKNAQKCGFQNNHNVSIWRSPDLSSGSWTFVGNAVECAKLPDCGILYRPHMVFNPTTSLYVVFWNYVTASNTGSRNGVATSPHPAGPWTVANPQMRTARPLLPTNHNGSIGDFDVLVDDDGSAYIVYSYGPMSIEKLTPDYFNSAGVNATFEAGPFKPSTCLPGTCLPEDFCEAPSLWRRGSTYFLTTGHCCCFCFQGSGMITYTAPHPLGPWRKQPGAADLGCITNASNPTPADQHSLPLTARLSPGQGCNYHGARAASVSRAQQNFVLPVHTPKGVQYIWTGDRWMQAPDGKKAHEPQFWAPLQFDDDDDELGQADGTLRPLKWVDEFTIEVLLPQPGA
jgi:hypothetical protein